MKASIQSRKHIVQESVFTVALGATTTKNVAVAVERTIANTVTEVVEGATIKAIFLEFWITSDDAAQGSCSITLEKRSSGAGAITFAEAQALDSYANKKNILYFTQGLSPPNVQSGIPFVRGWFKIPKGKQRFGLGDILAINFTGITNGANICGMAIYKEYN